MTSIADCLTTSAMLAATSDSPRIDCEILLAHVLGQSRTYLYTWPEKLLSSEQLHCFSQLLERRAQGEPIAYIIGQREFWSLSLHVEQSTLIPRPETELIVELALSLLPRHEPQSILDLGTGTGAIALALASECPLWQLLGVDRFDDIVALAQKNQHTLSIVNARFYQSDWFANIPQQSFDMIVANPPYIDPSDPHLEQGDVRYEPKSALVASRQGMADLDSIIQSAPDFLHAGAWLLLEHGYQQAEPVQRALCERGFVDCQSHQDLAGHLRVTMGRWSNGQPAFSD